MNPRRIVFAFLGVVCLFLLGEGSVRLYHKLFRGIPFTASAGDFYDKELGWKGKAVFGNSSSEKYKIFFIGDSFTEGCGVAEDNMYYSIVAENLNAEIFAYGGPGYGTLQEYMVLDRYIDEINPDLIVLQVCGNDFTNNLWELESESYYNNDLMTRPYFIGGKVVYLFPKFPGRLRTWLFSRFRFLYLLGRKADKFIAGLCKKGLLRSVESKIYREGTNFNDFRRAVEVTGLLVRKIKKRAARIPVVAFTVNCGDRQTGQFRKIFRENNIDFIEEVPRVINRKQRRGFKLTLKDGSHWNAAGHKVCGGILSEKLAQKRPQGRQRF